MLLFILYICGYAENARMQQAGLLQPYSDPLHTYSPQ